MSVTRLTRSNRQVDIRRSALGLEGAVGRPLTSNQLLFELNLEAWIRLDVFIDLVIASHKIGDGDPTSVSAEVPQFIKVERNELLNLENINPVRQARVLRETFSDGQAALPRDDIGRKPSFEIVATTLGCATDAAFRRRPLSRSIFIIGVDILSLRDNLRIRGGEGFECGGDGVD